MIQATQIRVGMILLYEGELCRVLLINHITPGNKRGRVKVEMRNLRTGNKVENMFRSEDTVEKAILSEKEMEFLYHEGDSYIFMDSTTYEQIQFSKDELGNTIHYLKPNTKVVVEFHEEKPLGVELPATMVLTITDTPPPMKGATASKSAKHAVLDNGLTVKVPEFIQVGDKVKVDTSTNEYVERA